MRYSKTYKKSISGLSILEAIVSTAIVGIGFIAILQMTNYSVQSIDNSGDRTKANFITSMLVEDVIGHRDTTYNNKSLIENFSENPWQATLNCGGGSSNQNIKNNIYDVSGKGKSNYLKSDIFIRVLYRKRKLWFICRS